ncbi:MAG TPA: cellulose biosynthesis protein BcsS [Bosea sp. (in: a-proteobacteria)]|uniref:cellulose biosynthesis protein BcsS n=1 Tax=Bosea sp. (in: a-proteobacteria) TaxID=1871050 RepID=UPI002E0E1555|nr:cellulose biosynthesis protein BcsS [Bosea sp. (in: a-proteobacteria)]
MPAILLACPLTSPAMAEDETTEERTPLSTVIFGSLEAGPTKTFAAIGVKKALTGGLASSGFRALLKVGGSQEQTGTRRPHGTAYKSEAQVLIGYEWRIGDTFLSLYAGPDYESELRDEPLVTVVTHRYGARLHGDLWMTPTPDTMLHASAYVSTIDGRVWGRVAPGWLLPQNLAQRGLYLGPEVEAYRESDYSKLRLGLHLTGLRFLGLSWRISGGWQSTSDRPSEAYATLGLHWQR